ncbi:TAXI family TRAP transporter solute-binding subunit [uncultured Sphaerochaeta sp.]|uniref:TAXI family TRAP transporter solute-binding subunit n=1 Tax=uncultured Sphaerochaeta sp. TaxID=886478 RepID=UPI002A0A8312|nr:TAXI family TRAP transporter solute-binding subunit [uncultured Sphaerochaeta sp.]
MKKSRVLLLLVALLIPVTLFAAGTQESGAKSQKTVINFPTAATTGAVYPLGAAMCNLWNTKLPNVRASAQASAGGIANLNMIADGEAQLGVAVTSIMYESYNGIGSFEGRANPNLRVMIGLYSNPNQVVVTDSSGINSLADLAGKRFASGAPGSTTEVETSIHLKTSGIDYPDGLKVQYVGFTEAIDLMRNKQLDGAWIMAGIPNAAVTEMLSTAGGKLLNIDESLIAKLKEKYPWYGAYTIPAGTYPKQDSDVLTSAIKLTICTDARVDADVVYELTKTFWENFDELKATQAPLKKVNSKDAVKDLAGLPLHEGAARYYREIGLL